MRITGTPSVMQNSDDGDLMRMRKDYSTSLLSRSTIPSPSGGNADSLLSNGPGLKTGVPFASGFRSGIVTQERLIPGLGPSSMGLEEWEAVNRSNCGENGERTISAPYKAAVPGEGKKRKQIEPINHLSL